MITAEDFMKGSEVQDTPLPQNTLSAEDFMKGDEVPTAQTAPTNPVPLADTKNSQPSFQTPQEQPETGIIPTFNNSIVRQGGWGLSPETREALGANGPVSALRPLTDLPANIADLAFRAGVQLPQAVLETGAAGLDAAARATGLNKALSYDGNEFLPGSGVMAAAEAFPMVGAEAGMVHPRIPDLNPQTSAALENLYKTGTTDEILDFAKQNNLPLQGGSSAVEKFVLARDEGRPVDTTVRPVFENAVEQQPEMAAQLQDEVTNFQQKKQEQEPSTLEQEAQSFQSKPEPTPESLFPTDESHAANEAGMQDKLQSEVDTFLANKTPEITPEDFMNGKTETPAESGSNPADTHVQNIKDEVRQTMDGWTNQPNVEVVHSLKDIADPDIRAEAVREGEGARGFVDRNGTVHLIGENLEPGDVKSVLFHEALGHYGMSQKFGSDLDTTLSRFYDDEPKFKALVDDWMQRNPDAYEDAPNKVARAADEVLAEMSEDGPLKATFINKIKNYIKATARKAGMKNLSFSDREINTILAMAHDSVMNGHGMDIASNGFRYKSRREQIQDATEELASTKNGETKTTQPFPEEEPDYHRFRHVTQDGKPVTGTYTISDGKIDNLSISAESGSRSIGPKTIRQIGRDLLEKHPEADSVQGYRISGARPKEEFVSSGNRFSRSKQYKERRMKSLSAETIAPAHGDEAKELLDFIHGRVNPLKTGSVSDVELNRIADDLGLSATKYLKSKSLKDQEVAATTVAARGILNRNVDSLLKNYQKARTTGMTPTIRANMIEKLSSSDAIYARLEENNSELGRALRSNQQAIAAQKNFKAALKYSKEAGDEEGIASLSDEALMSMMDRLERTNNELTPDQQAGELKKMLMPNYKDVVANVLNIPRTIMSSFDISAPMRQGLPLIHTKAFWKAWGGMFKSLGSQKAFDQILSDIRSHPDYELLQKAGVAITGHGGGILGKEEAFMSQLASSLPGVKHSERAFTAFLDKLRADTFNRLLTQYRKTGMDFDTEHLTKDDKQQLRAIGRFVNSATGRGDLGVFNQAAPLLSVGLFSPRFMASKIDLLTRMFRPSTYITLNPILRKEYLKALLAVGSIGLISAGAAKYAGADVEDDPRSSDFGKIKTGNTRYETMGGKTSLIVLAARLASRMQTPIGGKPKSLVSHKYGERDIGDILGTFVRSQLAPVPGTLYNKYTGTDVVGNDAYAKRNLPFTKVPVDKETLELFLPMITSDLYDLQQDRNLSSTSPQNLRVLPAAIGMSMQTFGPRQKKNKSAQPQAPAQLPDVAASSPPISADDFMKGTPAQ